MWYFSWVLGLGFACTFAILNAMWLESLRDRRSKQLSFENICCSSYLPRRQSGFV